MPLRHLIAISTVLLLTACATEPPTEEATSEEAHSDVIAWFDGTVEEAFEVAAEEGRPVFLYWGAVWCPPCHYLKDKIFQRPEFVERSANFVMVYLDGDTERAQVYGEKFGTLGYPTVIVFGADGEERMRMPSTVDPQLYGELLDQAMTMRPIGDVLASVRQDGVAATAPDDLHLLAFYSWGQDHLLELSPEELLETFEALHRETPEELREERSRFLALYLTQLIRVRGEDEAEVPQSARLDEARRAQLDGELRRLLNDPELRAVNLSLLFYWSADVVKLLHPEPSTERGTLIADWRRAAAAAEGDDSLTVGDRLAAFYPRLELAALEGDTGGEGEEPELPPVLLDEVREKTAGALAAVDDAGEMQSVLNTAAHLLEDAGLAEETEATLLGHMEEAKAPWYFMGWLGGLREEAGEPAEAIEWHRKAYETAEGRYTRFRWGSIYLRNLMDLAPEDEATIAVESNRVLAELLTFEDAFAHGNYSRLRQLDKAYRAWNEDGSRQQVVDAVRAQVIESCGDYPAEGEDSQASRCEAFLDPAA